MVCKILGIGPGIPLGMGIRIPFWVLMGIGSFLRSFLYGGSLYYFTFLWIPFMLESKLYLWGDFVTLPFYLKIH